MNAPLPFEEWLAKWTTPEPLTGCLLWLGAVHKASGYGAARRTRVSRSNLAHRVVYEETIGPIPGDLQLDHRCRQPTCVNARHLEPVTCRTNIIRGFGRAGVNARKLVCLRGHPFDAVNTKQVKGGRACRACIRIRRAA